jgi:putative transposase
MGKESTPSCEKTEGFFGPDLLAEGLRGRIREMVLALVEQEISEVLSAQPYERSTGRCGYRHGSNQRQLTTGLGRTQLEIPRARLKTAEGEKEWHSRLISRYQRRSASVDAALMGAYLSGSNQRRIKGALSPLLREAPLSKSAISRVVGRLASLFEQWRCRSLKEERIAILYLDAISLKVRIANKVVSAPVLVALGVRSDGQKVVLDLELLSSESTSAWGGFLSGLIQRGLIRPKLCVIDGNKGLRTAVEESWPAVLVQRCTVHKLRNLERYIPKHALEEMRADYHRIVDTDSMSTARRAYSAFIAKWEKQAPKVTDSLQEAGEELLTFYRFPSCQWKSLRTTNAIERLNGEFRRRVKTQGSLPNGQAAELLLFGLLASDQIRMRRIDGWQQLGQIVEDLTQQAA